MLTSQSKIAEQISMRLRQHTDDASIDERELMLAVHQKLGLLIRNRLFQSKGAESQEVNGSFYYVIDDNPVLKNRKGEYYTVMPSTSIDLPFGVDIKKVGVDKGRGFIPVPNGFNDLFDGLASSTLETNIGYYRSGAHLVFVNMSASRKPAKVNIEMAIPFDSLDEDDQINIPSDAIGEVVDAVFVDFARTLEIPTDDVNNNLDN